MKHTTYALLALAVAAFTGCTHTEHEVTVVHHTTHHVHTAPSTAPESYGVVNQYDRQSR